MADIMSALRKRGLEHAMIQNAAAIFSRMPNEWHQQLNFRDLSPKLGYIRFFWISPSAKISCYITAVSWTANYTYNGDSAEQFRMRIHDPIPKALVERIEFVISDIKINKK